MAIAYHNATTLAGTAGVASLNVPFRIGTLSERYLIVTIATRGQAAAAMTSVAWQADGATNSFLAPIGAQNHGSQMIRVEMWGLLLPTASTNTSSRIVVTCPASVPSFEVNAAVYYGVSQTTPTYGFNSATGTGIAGNTGTLTVTSATGDLVVDTLAVDFAANIAERARVSQSTTGQTSIINKVTNNATVTANVRGLMSHKDGAASTVMAWDFMDSAGAALNGRNYVSVGVALKKSTSIAPVWVMPPSTVTPSTVNLTTDPLTVDDNTNFTAAGILAVNPFYQLNTGANSWRTYTSKPASGLLGTFSGGQSGGGSVSQGLPIYNMAGRGALALTTVVNSFTMTLQTNAIANDIWVIAVLADNGSTGVTMPAGWTLINSSVATNGILSVYWHRCIAGAAQQGDLGSPTVTITSTAAGNHYFDAAGAVYRGCATSGSPIGTGNAAPTSATGAGTTPITAAITGTTVNGSTVVCVWGIALSNTPYPGWSTGTAGTNIDVSRRFVDKTEIQIGDFVVPTSGTAVGAKTQTTANATNSSYGAQMFVLLPSGSNTFNRSAPRTSAVPTITVSRAGSNWPRSAPRTSAAISATVKRLGSTWRRSNARTSATPTISVSRRAQFNRHAARVSGTLSSTVSRVGSTWRRTLNIVNQTPNIIVHQTLTGGAIWARHAAVTITGPIVTSVKRLGSTWRRTPTETMAAPTITSKRFGSTWRRSAARSSAVPIISVKRLGSTWRRTAARAGVSITVVCSRSLIAGTVQFYIFGPEPIHRLFTATDFTNATFYLEVEMKATNASFPAHARIFDETAPGVVAGSDITTTSATTVRVRSGALTTGGGGLVDGHVYHVEKGCQSPGKCVLTDAKLIVEIP